MSKNPRLPQVDFEESWTVTFLLIIMTIVIILGFFFLRQETSCMTHIKVGEIEFTLGTIGLSMIALGIVGIFFVGVLCEKAKIRPKVIVRILRWFKRL